ncbi:hypothetical protein Pmani_002315 [Petrolisthes manimaculis]|uniref:Uncharacterized protein n=1 Tax=Petrolisthes manimaculis TaxID=1843537 RepID=A0AAE1UJH0_9EUCA|nr:hypothetical protein Pmani_002315 [Petrolisthes manimaculis]
MAADRSASQRALGLGSEVLLKTEVLVAGGRVRTDRWQSGSSLPSLHVFPPPQNLASVMHRPVLFCQAVTELVLGDTLAAVASKLSVRVGTHCKTHIEPGVRELLPDPLSVVDADASCFQVGGFKEVLDKEYKTGWWIKDSEVRRRELLLWMGEV